MARKRKRPLGVSIVKDRVASNSRLSLRAHTLCPLHNFTYASVPLSLFFMFDFLSSPSVRRGEMIDSAFWGFITEYQLSFACYSTKPEKRASLLSGLGVRFEPKWLSYYYESNDEGVYTPLMKRHYCQSGCVCSLDKDVNFAPVWEALINEYFLDRYGSVRSYKWNRSRYEAIANLLGFDFRTVFFGMDFFVVPRVLKRHRDILFEDVVKFFLL